MVVLKDLKSRRLKIGLSQKNCAEKLDIPLRTYQRYESEEPIGDPEYLCRIVRLFSINIDELSQEEDNNYAIFEKEWENNNLEYIELALKMVCQAIESDIKEQKNNIEISTDGKHITLKYCLALMQYINEKKANICFER